ncbi:MAG: hypothetical protein LBR26_16050 [Prevotella sp.]|jgi:hypothetical protein|nr:hypothetical protein [Prevotella sp.]
MKMPENQTIPNPCSLSADELKARRNMFLDIAKKHIPDFTVDDSNRHIINDMFFYFNGMKGPYSLDKGLWIRGDIGTGKSSIINLFSLYKKQFFDGFKIHICSKVSNDYAINGDLDKYTYNEKGYPGGPVSMCFDELGRETIPANHYGQKLNVMQHIIHIRYSLWQSYGVKTFVTTNDDAKDVEDKYGLFIRDRAREMFNVVLMTGKSRRK